MRNSESELQSKATRVKTGDCICDLRLITHDLRVTGFLMTFRTVFPEISVLKISDDACSEGHCTLSLATITVIESVILNYTLLLTAQRCNHGESQKIFEFK